MNSVKNVGGMREKSEKRGEKDRKYIKFGKKIREERKNPKLRKESEKERWENIKKTFIKPSKPYKSLDMPKSGQKTQTLNFFFFFFEKLRNNFSTP